MPDATWCESPPRLRPRVLLLAYACSPYRGSEPGVGWNRAVQTARHFDTWVLCEGDECAADIGRYLKENGPIEGLHFVFVSLRPWELRCRQRFVVGQLAMRRWQRRAFATARQLHAQLRFDLVHHVNLCGFREPGYLWRLDVPFVWGPVGGSQNCPWRFLPWLGWRDGPRETLRSIVNWLQLRFSPRVRRAVGKASVLLTANSTNQRDFQRVYGRKPKLLLETGLTSVADQPAPHPPGKTGLRILWSSRFDGTKALPLLLHALAELPADLPFTLRILGKGPRESLWRRLAAKLGLERSIEWLGHLPFDEAMDQYAWADLFVFTSLRDTSGNVVLEALAHGRPVIAFDHQGVHDMLDDRCGIKIPLASPAAITASLREAIERLGRDAALRDEMGRAAIERAKTFLWSSQQADMCDVYREVLEHAASDAEVPDEALTAQGARP